MDSAITAHVSAAATIHAVILFDSSRHSRSQRAWLADVAAGDDVGGDDIGGDDIGGDDAAGKVPWGVVGS
jgi:hypothetical protein